MLNTYQSRIRQELDARRRDRKIKRLFIKYVVLPLGLDDWLNKAFMAFTIIVAGVVLAAFITSSVGQPIAAAF